jgi:UDP-N-acetylmuramate dehydrogenase
MFSQNISLKPFNTFGIDVRCNFFAEITQLATMQGIVTHSKWQHTPKLILGGGSNILFTKNYEGLVIKNNILGIEKIVENQNHVWLEVGAGENWHNFVLYAIENNYGGIENLSLIPGTVGASPMQNIGAYGVEVKDVIEKVTVVSLETGEVLTLSNQDCHFGYRDSIFKTMLKHKVMITSVVFRLTKHSHAYNVSYGAISQILAQQNITTQNITLKAISEAVIAIRQSKLPNPAEIGNAGSFFKNPTIDKMDFEKLKEQYPNIVSFATENPNLVKIPAGWLIEQCEWKGKRVGNTGIHKDQALVIVNYGGATGHEIWQLATEVQKSVANKFDIVLQMEVNVY